MSLLNSLNVNDDKSSVISAAIRNYILLKMKNHSGGEENLRHYSLKRQSAFECQSATWKR